MSQTFALEGLTIVATVEPKDVTLALTGTSDSRSPNEWFEGLAKTLNLAAPERRVQIDLSRLEFMNSATVGALVSLVKRLDERGVATSLKYNGAMAWQRMNAQCMQVIARCLKHITVEVA
jgi:anti-anti-sigma regulatory factor